jgi:hypothetical protein
MTDFVGTHFVVLVVAGFTLFGIILSAVSLVDTFAPKR